MNKETLISIVIPLYNEEESLKPLTEWIDKTMQEAKLSYELLLIDDGSTDDSWEEIERLSKINASIVGIKFFRNYGKSAALFEGFKECQGDFVFTMDADLQDDPNEIPQMLKMIIEGKLDMVSGWKKLRHDSAEKRFPSKLFNKTASLFSGIKLHDFNCGIKGYRKKVIKNIEVYGEMHRYIPILAKQAGFKKIGEKVVTHHKRQFGESKFGWERYMRGYLDLLSVLFVSKFGRKPMYFFGTAGTIMFFSGFLITIYIIWEKFYDLNHGIIPRGIVDQPLFFIALLLTAVGIQFFLAGYLGELIARNGFDRNKYNVEEVIYKNKKVV